MGPWTSGRSEGCYPRPDTQFQRVPSTELGRPEPLAGTLLDLRPQDKPTRILRTPACGGLWLTLALRSNEDILQGISTPYEQVIEPELRAGTGARNTNTSEVRARLEQLVIDRGVVPQPQLQNLEVREWLVYYLVDISRDVRYFDVDASCPSEQFEQVREQTGSASGGGAKAIVR